jgi:hypothetical protein
MRLATRGGDAAAPLDVNKFVLEHGRMRFLSDPIPPWHYRGWLLFQVQLADAHPVAPGRWRHYLRTMKAGHLLDEPIPEISFSNADPAGMKMITKCVDLLTHSGSVWSAFERFVAWLSWGLAVSKEMPGIEEATAEALYRTFNFERLLSHPYDYLGEILAGDRAGGWNPNAFYPTPHPICEMITRMCFGGDGGERDPRLRTVNEPAVGTGRMLLHASNYSYRLSGMDKDRLVVDICLCNGAFYAPWLSFPFSEWILKGNSSQQQASDQTLQRTA